LGEPATTGSADIKNHNAEKGIAENAHEKREVRDEG
jgi:hypothetical protein